MKALGSAPVLKKRTNCHWICAYHLLSVSSSHQTLPELDGHRLHCVKNVQLWVMVKLDPMGPTARCWAGN